MGAKLAQKQAVNNKYSQNYTTNTKYAIILL